MWKRVPALRDFRLAFEKAAADPRFKSEHGSYFMNMLQMMIDVKRGGDESRLEEVCEQWKARMEACPHFIALSKVIEALQAVEKEPEVAKNGAVKHMLDYMRLGMMYSMFTYGDPLDAFVALFSGAEMRVSNRRRAISAHAPKKAILAEGWKHFKKAKYSSLAEGARACANHYRTPGAPTERAFLDYFREQAKAEGITFKPGRKKVAKKPLKRAA